MISGILGKKVGMTQIFVDDRCVPVTVIQAGPCKVLQTKTEEKDGYNAIQLGFEDKREKVSTKSEIGHAKKAESAPQRFVKEIAWDGKDENEAKPGTEVTVAALSNFKFLDIVGTTKGKGFQGVVRRHGFAGGKGSHGQSSQMRRPGSIGQSAYPARVFKGMRMAGQMGSKQCTQRNVRIVKIDEEKGLISVKGAVPGHNGSFLLLKRSLTDK